MRRTIFYNFYIYTKILNIAYEKRKNKKFDIKVVKLHIYIYVFKYSRLLYIQIFCSDTMQVCRVTSNEKIRENK